MTPGRALAYILLALAVNTHAGLSMQPFRSILVPTDFSPYADEAVSTAIDLSLRYSAPLTLVHVLEPVTYAIPDGYMLYTPLQIRELSLIFERRLAAAKVDAEAAGAQGVETRLLNGAVAPEICEYAKTGKFDLIVMGTHGRRGFQRLILGSVTEKVLRTAGCDVLGVHAPHPEH
jgi:nucleotide-binding universal stress UspA family protein